MISNYNSSSSLKRMNSRFGIWIYIELAEIKCFVLFFSGNN